MKIIINNPRRVTVGNGMSILYDTREYTEEQLIKLIEDCLITKSIIADEIRVFK